MCVKLCDVYERIFYMILSSVVFQAVFSEKENKMLKMEFDSIKNTAGGSSCLCVPWW